MIISVMTQKSFCDKIKSWIKTAIQFTQPSFLHPQHFFLILKKLIISLSFLNSQLPRLIRVAFIACLLVLIFSHLTDSAQGKREIVAAAAAAIWVRFYYNRCVCSHAPQKPIVIIRFWKVLLSIVAHTPTLNLEMLKLEKKKKKFTKASEVFVIFNPRIG